jgi:hypothetical protein
VPFPANGTNQVWSQEFLPWFAGRSTVAVLYDADDWTDAIIRGLERLARHGLWCLMAPNVIVATSVVRNLHRIAPGRAIFHLDRWDLLRAPLLPTALVFSFRRLHWRTAGLGAWSSRPPVRGTRDTRPPRSVSITRQ